MLQVLENRSIKILTSLSQKVLQHSAVYTGLVMPSMNTFRPAVSLIAPLAVRIDNFSGVITPMFQNTTRRIQWQGQMVVYGRSLNLSPFVGAGHVPGHC